MDQVSLTAAAVDFKTSTSRSELAPRAVDPSGQDIPFRGIAV